MPPKSGMIWNADAYMKVLAFVVQTSNVKIDYDGMASMFTTDTVTCTPKAATECITKIKRMAKNGDLGDYLKQLSNEGPSTPASAKATPKRKRMTKAKETRMDPDETELEVQTPPRKAKKPAAPTQGKDNDATGNESENQQDDGPNDPVETALQAAIEMYTNASSEANNAEDAVV